MRRGLWIPVEYLQDPKISAAGRILLAECAGWEASGKDAFVSNRYLSELCGVSVASIKRLLDDLEGLGYLEKSWDKDPGKRRLILTRPPAQSAPPPVQDDPPPRLNLSHYKNRDKNNYKNSNNGKRDKTKRLLGELDEYSRRTRR